MGRTKNATPGRKTTMTPKKAFKKTELKKIFDVIDSDESGMITADELLAASDLLDLDGITPARIKKMMKDADTNGDGGVDFEEFVEVMKTSREWQGCVTPSLMMKSVMHEADAIMAVGDGVLAPVRASFADHAPLRTGKEPLASGGTRFCSLLCTNLGYVAAAAVGYAAFAFGVVVVFSSSAVAVSSPQGGNEVATAVSASLGMMIIFGSMIFFVFYALVNLSLLCKGQSLGKWCVGTHVVHKRDGNPISCCSNLFRTIMVTTLWPYLAIHLMCCGNANNNQHFVDMCFDTEVVHKVDHSHRA